MSLSWCVPQRECLEARTSLEADCHIHHKHNSALSKHQGAQQMTEQTGLDALSVQGAPPWTALVKAAGLSGLGSGNQGTILPPGRWLLGPQQTLQPTMSGVTPLAQSTLWKLFSTMPLGCASCCALRDGHGTHGYSVLWLTGIHDHTSHTRQGSGTTARGCLRPFAIGDMAEHQTMVMRGHVACATLILDFQTPAGGFEVVVSLEHHTHILTAEHAEDSGPPLSHLGLSDWGWRGNIIALSIMHSTPVTQHAMKGITSYTYHFRIQSPFWNHSCHCRCRGWCRDFQEAQVPFKISCRTTEHDPYRLCISRLPNAAALEMDG
ncbi:hypothetical protein SRHO_G00213980 [Serrasalmus rhombeus]